jgi:hypothetical protein
LCVFEGSLKTNHMANNNTIKRQGTGSDTAVSVSPFHKLLSHEVTRSQFLKILGIATISIFGFSSIIHFLTGKHTSPNIASITTKPISTYGHKSGGPKL